MNRFLIETSYRPDDEPQLHVFDDIGLFDFLRANIERQHYEGDGCQIRYIGQYLGNGKLGKLTLTLNGEYQAEDDCLTSSYDLTGAGRTDLGEDFFRTWLIFNVCIDGRV